MSNKKHSQTIKTAFILAIVGGVSVDAIAIIYVAMSGFGSFSYPTFSATMAAIVFVFVALMLAPLVFGIISLNLIKNAKPQNPRDRVFRILTKVFSIINIVGGALLIFYVLVFAWLIAMLVTILSGQEALIALQYWI